MSSESARVAKPRPLAWQPCAGKPEPASMSDRLHAIASSGGPKVDQSKTKTQNRPPLHVGQMWSVLGLTAPRACLGNRCLERGVVHVVTDWPATDDPRGEILQFPLEQELAIALQFVEHHIVGGGTGGGKIAALLQMYRVQGLPDGIVRHRIASVQGMVEGLPVALRTGDFDAYARDAGA